MQVPVLDLKAQYAALEAEIDAALKRVCRTASFRLGPEVEKFEADWAAYCQAGHCVGVDSGTAALHLALVAAGVGPGDEVITTPLTFFATAEAILYVGAKPVFVDIDPHTFCLAPPAVEAAVTSRTRAIVPVNLFGHPADMEPILAIAERHGLIVIEDAAQAHGALYKGRKVGALGHIGAFSFYPTKNLGAYGEAGAVVTNDAALAERVRMLRNHGQSEGYFHSMVGYNYRMDGFQGAVLNVKLPYLEQWNRRRRQIAAYYSQVLADTPLQLPTEADYASSAWHLYVVRCAQRDSLLSHLKAAGIAATVHYPVLIPDLEAMKRCDFVRMPLPEAQKAAKGVLSLPLYPEMSDEQVEYVIASVRRFFGRA